MKFTQSPLPYDMSALEPFMSKETLEYHYGKHHKAYIDTLNDAIKGTEFENQSLEEIVKNTYNKEAHAKIFNNASQAWNHAFFWPSMCKGGKAMPATLSDQIKTDFGSIEKFKDDFKAAGLGQFGSGWCWLVMDKNNKLMVTKTPNGVNPLCFGQKALLGCDVWEHSYYIDHRNARAKYLETFLNNLVDWEFVARTWQSQEGFKAAA